MIDITISFTKFESKIYIISVQSIRSELIKNYEQNMKINISRNDVIIGNKEKYKE